MNKKTLVLSPLRVIHVRNSGELKRGELRGGNPESR